MLGQPRRKPGTSKQEAGSENGKEKARLGKRKCDPCQEEVTWLHLFITSTDILNNSVSVTLSSELFGGVGK